MSEEEIFHAVIIEQGHISEDDQRHHSPVMVPEDLSARDSCGDGTFEFKFSNPKIRWPESAFPIKVFIDQTNSEIGSTVIGGAVQNALDEWQSRFNGKKMFELTTNASQAKITIGWKTLDGGGRTVAQCWYYWNNRNEITKNEIHFDTSENWTIMDREVCGSSGNAFDFQSVLTHELGHGVGFAHNNDPLSCLYPSVRFGETLRRTLSLGDEKGFRELYEITAPPPTPVNKPPIASDIDVETDQDISVDIQLKATDPDGQIVSYTISRQPTNGTVSLTGSIAKYTPRSGFAGGDVFRYTAKDDKNAVSNEAIVSIEIKSRPLPPENHPPTVKNISLEMNQGEDISIHLDGSDPDGHALTYEITKQPKNGAFALDPRTGHVQYRPNDGWFGMESFTYIATDELGLESQPADVVIVVHESEGGGGDEVEIVIKIPEDPDVNDVLDAFIGLIEQIDKLVDDEN